MTPSQANTDLQTWFKMEKGSMNSMPLPRPWVPGEGQKQGATSAQREGGQGLRTCEEKPKAWETGGRGHRPPAASCQPRGGGQRRERQELTESLGQRAVAGGYQVQVSLPFTPNGTGLVPGMERNTWASFPILWVKAQNPES